MPSKSLAFSITVLDLIKVQSLDFFVRMFCVACPIMLKSIVFE